MNQKRWLLDNFEVELKKTDEGVLIQAEDQIQGKVFLKLLNHESVKSISADPFFDLDTFHQLLQDYFEKKPENTFLSISNTGKLNYSSQFLFVTVLKKFEFELQLDKQELDANTRLANQVSKLSDKIMKLELEKDAVTNALKNFEKVVLEKFEKLESTLTKAEERITRLEKSDEVEIPQWEWNLTPELQTKFQVSDNTKTALSLSGTPYSIFAKQSLPKMRKSKLSFLIRKSNWMMIGISAARKDSKQHAYNDPASFAYSHDGRFYLSGPKGNYSQYKEGDQVSFTCDMTTGIIKVSLNGNFVGNYTIPKDQLNSQNFYPFLYTNNNAGVGATLI